MLEGRSKEILFGLAMFGLVACGGYTDTGGVNGGYGGGGGDYGGGYSGGNNFGGGGNLGATPGGAQDIAQAREMIEAGQLPSSGMITVEGLLSEHDLPVSGEPCEDLLCIRPALGIAPNLQTGENEAWVHIGMMSGFTDETFERPPLDAVIVIDRSSSMSVDMEETNDAANDIIDHLNEDDGLAIVTFNGSADEFLAPSRVGDIDVESIKSSVRGIDAKGRANLMAGLEKGYSFARQFESGDERMTRVFVLSCGYPDSHNDGEGTFVDLVESGGQDGIGMTFLGVLLHHDYQLAQALSTKRGGNYYSTGDLSEIETLFEEEFDYLATPLAYDLRFKLGVDGANYKVAELYGIPGEEGASDPGFEVSTAFISKRKGAMVARLEPLTEEPAESVATVSFSYEPEAAHGWSDPVDASVPLTHGGGAEQSNFDSDGVRKSVALVNMAERMKDALDQSDVEILEQLRDYLTAEADALDDDALRAEVELVEKLIALM